MNIRSARSPLDLSSLLRLRPSARAELQGSEAYPQIRGTVLFRQTPYGTLVAAELDGLPQTMGGCASPIFGFHIHEGARCAGNAEDPFAQAGSHYNPRGCPHPYHAGDLPPIFGAGGYARSAFLTDRFTAEELPGKTVILHASPDDFTTQPAGNAGMRIACGEIVRARR